MGKDKAVEPPAELVLPSGSQTIRVAQSDGEIVVFDGNQSTTYKVKGGAIQVDAAHVAAVLANVPGSELKPEARAKEAP